MSECVRRVGEARVAARRDISSAEGLLRTGWAGVIFCFKELKNRAAVVERSILKVNGESYGK